MSLPVPCVASSAGGSAVSSGIEDSEACWRRFASSGDGRECVVFWCNP